MKKKNPKEIEAYKIPSAIFQYKGKHRSEMEILDDVDEMVSNFSTFQLIHTTRETNFATYLCAQHASSSIASFVWFDPPSFLQPCLQYDGNNAV